MRITIEIVHTIYRAEKKRFNEILDNPNTQKALLSMDFDRKDSIYIYKKNSYVLIIAPHYGDQRCVYLNMEDILSTMNIRSFIRDYYDDLLMFAIGINKEIIRFYNKGWL